jgi:hypothetical protein
MEELLERVNKLTLRVQSLEEQVLALQNGEYGSGVYLEGAPTIVQKYVNAQRAKKDESEV